jgi:hypothetical protein
VAGVLYKAEALLDLPPEQGAQAAGGASAVERVRTELVERDDALRRAREDLEGARSLASSWEAEVTTARAQSPPPAPSPNRAARPSRRLRC